ncbi:MAG: hypothetical protein Q7U69_05025 [Sulfuricurvum sp.]|uniref:hypothetical protein n=1 Tax=Sulfuricurvum sp. TaxID=2025608 RepID=UPI0027292FF5|nr:hypothetical protein [Sulfuricurvum sp.]MDO9055889.1 hypothetical protein [Sulfuricurvum sp.]
MPEKALLIETLTPQYLKMYSKKKSSLYIILISLFMSYQSFANEQVMFTIKGEKDSTLEAQYEMTYVATKFDKWYCQGKRGGDGIGPKSKKKSYDIDDGNYTINIPIEILDPSDSCSMEFKTLNLIVKRKSDNDHYNHFPIAGIYPSWNKELEGNWAEPIYNGEKYGMGSPSSWFRQSYHLPYAYRSNQKYFRVASTTTFNCFTSRSDHSKNANFMCLMDISNKRYEYQQCTPNIKDLTHECSTVHHPDFGFENLSDHNLTINLYTDNNLSIKWNSKQKKLEKDTFQK